MFIKYKGNTGALLKELSLILNMPVDLKKSEEILVTFFELALQSLSQEEQMEILICLPPALKPFGLSVIGNYTSSGTSEGCKALFTPPRLVTTLKGIFSTLEKYVVPEKLAIIYSCFPDDLFVHSLAFKQAAVCKVL